MWDEPETVDVSDRLTGIGAGIVIFSILARIDKPSFQLAAFLFGSGLIAGTWGAVGLAVLGKRPLTTQFLQWCLFIGWLFFAYGIGALIASGFV